jgi:uncharacterized Tic20 family protein
MLPICSVQIAEVFVLHEYSNEDDHVQPLAYLGERSSFKENQPRVAQWRVARSLRQRAEEQVVSAILHASSPYFFFAVAASSVVWTQQRARSRFLTFQSLQALLFQLFTFLVVLLVFALFAAGFLFAAFTGLIARTGVTEPELTAFLINSALLGFGVIHFFLFIFPLWGVWAAVQVLRGRNFRYPIMGRLATQWMARQVATTGASPARQTGGMESATNESILAGLVHLSLLGGFGPILSPILWATARQRSEFLTYHLLQAALFQLLTIGVLLVMLLGGLGLPLVFIVLGILLPPEVFQSLTHIPALSTLPTVCTGMIGLWLLVAGILALTGAIRAFKGREFHYPIVGGWLARYVEAAP